MNGENYMLAMERKKAAYEKYNYASAHLENCQIKERLSEIWSQHEPLASLLESKMTERERLYSAAFYVVVGRMPE